MKNARESTGGWGRLALMALLVVLPGLSGLAAEDQPTDSDRLARAKRQRLLEIYTREAEEYTIYHDRSRSDKAELRRTPVYVWTNPVRAGGQDGMVFVWTSRGCVDAVGTFFSYPSKGQRGMTHELHSLAPTALDVSREGAHKEAWTPQVPGIRLMEMPGAPTPAKSPAQRLMQMRALTREFSGTAQDQKDIRWKLRLLPQPLYRFESTNPEVLDGALFAYVTSAGTDPEAFLILEARSEPGKGEFAWYFGAARYTDMSLKMRHKDTEILSVPQLLGPTDPKDVYRIFHDRVIPPVEEKLEP